MTMKMRYLGGSNIVVAAVCLLATLVVIRGALAEQCGWQAGGALCANGLCCSQYGWCGSTIDYCGKGCQSQCGGTPGPVPPSPPTGGDVTDIISSATFNQMLLHRNTFYSYDAFVAAARSFPGFATSGDTTIRKREVAAFLAQTSHETTGGWPTAPDGPYACGYYFIKEQGNPGSYCDPNNLQWPCAPGKSYYGRGPIQIS